MVDSDSPPASSPSPSLLCQEAQAKEKEETEKEEHVYEFGYLSDKERDEDDAYIQILLHRELNSQSSDPQMINDWIKSTRLDSIKWILNVSFAFISFFIYHSIINSVHDLLISYITDESIVPISIPNSLLISDLF